MTLSMKLMFLRYVLIGVLNTGLHWLIFFVGYGFLAWTQGRANLVAFFGAATFSFFMNARFTFKASATSYRYFIFMVFMATLSYGFGRAAEAWQQSPFLMLAAFSLSSLMLGFLYSRYIVFSPGSGQ